MADTPAPEDACEEALGHRMAAAFQRLEKADHLETRTLDAALVRRETTTGAILAHQHRVQSGFAAVNRYRATTRKDLFNADGVLEVYRHERGRETPHTRVLPNEA